MFGVYPDFRQGQGEVTLLLPFLVLSSATTEYFVCERFNSISLGEMHFVRPGKEMTLKHIFIKIRLFLSKMLRTNVPLFFGKVKNI